MTVKCVKSFFEMHIAGSAAELSYYFLFSVFSLMMASGTVTLSAGIGESVLVNLTDSLVPELVSDMLEEFHEHIGGRGASAYFSAGVFLSLYSIARYINRLKRKIREIYGNTNNMVFWREWFISFGFSVIIVLGFVFTFLLQTAGEKFLAHISDSLFFIPENAVHTLLILRFAVIGIYVFVLMLLVYSAIPGIKVSFCDVRMGATISATAWIIVSVVFSYYTDNFSDYAASYGAFGAFVVLMLWLFLMNNVILIGALINKVKFDENVSIYRKIFL